MSATVPPERAPSTSTGAGIAYICAGAFCMVTTDAFDKYLYQSLPVIEILFFRMLFTLPLLMLVAVCFDGRQALVSRAPALQVARGVAATVASLTYIFALGLMPLADAAAIGYTSPLFITLLAIPLLRERPRWQQWAATILGFGGVVLVAQPGTAFFSWAALLPLASACAYALIMVTARTLAERGDSIWVTMIYSTCVPLLVSGAFVALDWKLPDSRQILMLAGVGILGCVAITLVTQAFRVGTASVVAPFDYTGLLWSALIGWLVWNEIPGASAMAGLVLILLAGGYLAWQRGGRGGQHPAAVCGTALKPTAEDRA
ncbi:MAG TPA: DMT family transporter [Nevskiaceae bacterium]|nr:DMT family transporter [Nevskiaceae bacterium]